MWRSRFLFASKRVLEPDPDGTTSTESKETYARWKGARDEALLAGSTPSISVQTVTAASREAAADDKVLVEVVGPPDPDRPGGRRFGALVHGILATVDLNAAPAEIGATAKVQGRMVGASEPEVEAAVDAVVAALAHPIMRRAAGAVSLRRETPVLLRREDGILLEGVVDLAFEEGEGSSARWTIVDFKTDKELESSRQAYTAQVEIYAEAIGKAIQAPVDGVLLVI